MWSILVQDQCVKYKIGVYRTKEAARIHLFDMFMGFQKEFWSIIGDEGIVNHTGSGDVVYSIVKISRPL